VLESSAGRIAIDMSGIRYVSARVLGVIANFVRRARESRGEVTVVCPDTRLRQFLEGMGFRHVVEMVASLSDALGSFSGGIVTPEKLMLWNDSEVYAGA
jgi:anti-anti-sigma factor